MFKLLHCIYFSGAISYLIRKHITYVLTKTLLDQIYETDFDLPFISQDLHFKGFDAAICIQKHTDDRRYEFAITLEKPTSYLRILNTADSIA